MKSLKLIYASTFFVLMCLQTHLLTAQTWSNAYVSVPDDGYIINSDNSNNFSWLRLQTGSASGWSLVNEGKSLSFRFSKSHFIPSQTIGSATMGTERMKIDDAGNLTIAGTLVANEIFANSSIKLPFQNELEFGFGVEGKQVDAGKIVYAKWSNGLDIIGAGSAALIDRRITLWAEAGINLNGPLRSGYGDAGLVNIYNGIDIGYKDNYTVDTEGGKIMYAQLSDGLDIVGAATLNNTSTNNTSTRKITLWAEGGIACIGSMMIGNGDSRNFSQLSANVRNNYNLYVTKGIVSENLTFVNISSWKDHIFSSDYTLPKLTEVEAYIRKNKHLEGIPSEDEVRQNGYSVHQLNLGLLEKIEQLMLYNIQQEKEINLLADKMDELKQLKHSMEELLRSLKK